MARCQRCNGCTSMWSEADCSRCSFPKPDSRTPEEIVEDDEDRCRTCKNYFDPMDYCSLCDQCKDQDCGYCGGCS